MARSGADDRVISPQLTRQVRVPSRGVIGAITIDGRL